MRQPNAVLSVCGRIYNQDEFHRLIYGWAKSETRNKISWMLIKSWYTINNTNISMVISLNVVILRRIVYSVLRID